MQRVQDVMTPHPKTCEMDHPIACTLDLMHREDVGSVPVVDKDNRVIGMITDRDIALSLLDQSKVLQDMRVRDVVTTDWVVTVKPTDDVHRATEMMERHQVRRLPVVDEQGHCVGIVAQADIVLKDQDRQDAMDMVKGVSEERPAMSRK